MRQAVAFAACALVSALAPDTVSAHHVMDGETPQTLMQGLLSGFGHPVIGLDHLAMVIGVGLLASLAGAPLWLPVAFVAGTLAGTAVHLSGIDIPLAEMAIAESVLATAVAVFFRARLSAILLAVLFAGIGLFHGYAYGESIVGAEPAPLYAYLAGFSLIQYAIAAAAALGFEALTRRGDVWQMATSRVAGATIAAVGLTALWPHLF